MTGTDRPLAETWGWGVLWGLQKADPVIPGASPASETVPPVHSRLTEGQGPFFLVPG